MSDKTETSVSPAEYQSQVLLGNRYELTRSIGVGGMAEVFEGFDTILKRRVAIKIMLPQYEHDALFVVRFEREAQAAAQLNNQNAVRIFDVGVDSGRHYIVMELARGGNLKQLIRQMGPISPRIVAEIARQSCSALRDAHAIGVIHRDIKPANIAVGFDAATGKPIAKIMDFGIAKAGNLFDAGGEESRVMGTPSYMSPEQFEGGAVTPASDLYSLGVTMYEACTCCLPFYGEGSELAWKHVSAAPVSPQQLNAEIDDEMNGIILQALAKNPADRFATASDMLAALTRYLDAPDHPPSQLAYPEYWALGFMDGPAEIVGKMAVVSQASVLGRDEGSDIVVADQSVSRSHVRLCPRGNYLEIENLSETNGTFVNGEPLFKKRLCSAGFVVETGTVRFKVGRKMG